MTEDPRRHRIRHLYLRIALLLGVVLAVAAPAGAVDPYQDLGFAPATPRPDADLVVVRERSYGAEGVDLSAFGIGAGPQTFVQSLYFRLFVDHDLNLDSFTGQVILPPELSILGIITDGALLGGETDDGLWTASDAIFGVGDDPDRYSEDARGFETGGGNAQAEFIGLVDAHTFVFGLNVDGGVDDFRVIVDHGDAFGDDLAFDILAYDIGVLGGAIPADGIRVGDETNPIVFGSGDYGETPSLLDIPLTAVTPAVPSDAIPFDPLASLYILRDTAGSTWVDGYDTTYDLPLPGLFEMPTNMSSPAGITDGNDGLLYAVGQGGGWSVLDPQAMTAATTVLDDLAGTNMDLTNLPGYAELYVLRDAGSTTVMDVVDPGIPTIVSSHTTAGAASPMGITDGTDGLLYIIDAGGRLSWLAADGSAPGSQTLVPPSGTYVDLTSRPGSTKLYLLRDTTGDSAVDVFDTATQGVTYSLSTFASPSAPVGITDGPGDRVSIIGPGTGAAAGFAVIDPESGAILVNHQIMDFEGSNIRLSNIALPTAAPGLEPQAAAGIRCAASPSPFSERVEIRYELAHEASAVISIHDVQGRRLRVLNGGRRAAGWHAAVWDGKDQGGVPLPTGIYFYRVQAGVRAGGGKIQRLR